MLKNLDFLILHVNDIINADNVITVNHVTTNARKTVNVITT